MRWLSFLVLAILVTSPARSAPAGKAPYPPLLYTLLVDGKNKQQSTRDQKAYLGNRIHFVYFPASDRFMFALTDIRGNFRIPAEVIGTGTVLRGEQLGHPNATDHFLLTEKGKWVPTKQPFRMITFTLDGKSPMRIESEERAEDQAVGIPSSEVQFKDG